MENKYMIIQIRTSCLYRSLYMRKTKMTYDISGICINKKIYCYDNFLGLDCFSSVLSLDKLKTEAKVEEVILTPIKIKDNYISDYLKNIKKSINVRYKDFSQEMLRIVTNNSFSPCHFSGIKKILKIIDLDEVIIYDTFKFNLNKSKSSLDLSTDTLVPFLHHHLMISTCLIENLNTEKVINYSDMSLEQLHIKRKYFEAISYYGSNSRVELNNIIREISIRKK